MKQTSTKTIISYLLMLPLLAVSTRLAAQAPVISYASPQVYSTGSTITPLAPSSSNVGSPGYGSPSVLGSGLTFSQNGLALDAAGNIYVTDQDGSNEVVKKISADGSTTTIIGSGFTNQSSNIVVDQAGNVFVADQSVVSEIPASGSPVTYGTPVVINNSFSRPFAIAADAAGNLFVSDLTNGGVYKMAADGSNKTRIDNGLTSVTGLAIDAAGNVYASDLSAQALYKIPANGSQVQLATGLGFPRGLAVDAAGTVYIDDESQGGIYAVPAGGGTPVAVVPGLTNLVGIAVDAGYNLYGALQGSGGINKFSPTGGYFVNPLLPAGLKLNATTGVICGTPTVAMPAADYIIYAYNSAGGTSAILNITVLQSVAIDSLKAAGNNPTNATTVNYVAKFSAPVTGLTASNFSLASGSTGATMGTPATTDGGLTWTIPVTNCTGEGTLQLSLANFTGLPGYVMTSTLPFAGDTYKIDHTAPVMVSGSYLSTNGTTINYSRTGDNITLSIGFNEHIRTPTLTIGGHPVTMNNVFGDVWQGTYTVTPADPDGHISFDLTLTDLAGNTVEYTSDNVVPGGVYINNDNTPPTASISAPSVASAGNNGSFAVIYTITYSDANFNSSTLSTAGITLNTTGTATGAVSLDGSGRTYTVTISNITGLGTLGISLAGGYATDLSGNTDNGVAPSATFNVLSSNAALSSLAAAPGPLSPGFNPGVTSYTVSVPNTTAKFAVTPVTADPNATIAVNGSALASGVKSDPITLSEGAVATVNVVVTAQDSITTQTYAVNVTRAPSGNANLTSIGASSGPLSPAFSAGTSSYTVSVPNGTSKFTVTPLTANPNATLTVNGSALAPGSKSDPIVLAEGATATVTIVVTAQDGTTTQTYTVAVSRAPSSNAALSNIGPGVGPLSPAFSPATTNYTINVPNGRSSITVTPVTANANATMTVNGTALTSGNQSAPVALPEGQTTNINIAVTAQDGTTTQTYTVAVSRAPSSNAALTSLTPSPGPLSPAFTSGNSNYSIILPNGKSSITFTPVTADANATITINGTSVSSGNASQSIALTEGATTNVAVLVTAQDGTTTQTYTVAVSRAPSSNAALSSIGANPGPLSPAFSSGTTSYTLSLANSKPSATFTPVTTDPNATVTVNGTAVNPGSASQPITLDEGTSATVTIVVTAQDGTTTKTYTVAVSRAPSANAALTGIGLSTGSLSPVFSAATTNYTVNLPNSKSSISFTPVTADANATLTVNGTAVNSGSSSQPIVLTEGTTAIVNIVVTAQDGTTKTYTIAVNRAPSTNATLTSVGSQYGPLAPGFSPGTTSYTLNVPNSRSTITMTPVSTDANATITVNGSPVASGSTSSPIALTAGVSTSINIAVSAQNGTTTQTYTIAVTRAPSSNAALAGMGPQYGPLSPVFQSGTTNYTVNVPNSRTSFTVTPVTADATATMTVNGSPLTSGSTSSPIALTAGVSTNINIVITAQDGTTTKTYTVAVTRALSGNAALAGMGPQYGPLSPVFQSGTTNYTVNVPNSRTSFTVTPVTADATATMTVNGSPLTSGSTSSPIALTAGASTNINVVVTAQDGTTKTYTIQATRLLANDADLSAMGPQYGPLSPVFAAATTNYTVSVANSKSTFTVTPVTQDANATIAVNGTALASGSTSDPVALAAGSTTNISVIVTAQDGTTTKTYIIAVTRAPGSGDGYQDISVTKPNETVILAEDGIKVHQGISPNGDGIDDVLQIDNISQYPDNHLKIMNRNGQLVFEAKGYDNTSKVFDGRSNKNGQMQLPGTYFFQLDYTVNGAIKTKTGYLVLKY